MPRLTVLLPVLVFFLAGCAAVGPDYTPPQTDMPSAWHTPLDPALETREHLVLEWWKLYNDPLLTRLITEAATGNLGLKEAVARVDEARAQLGIALGEEVPSLDADAGITRYRTSKNNYGLGKTDTLYAPGVSASWEVDLFGRIRRSVEAAGAEFQATREDRTDVMISLYAQVARTYLNIRTYQARLAAADANIASQKQVLGLTRSKFKYGLATSLDVAQAERVLASSEATIPPLRIELSKSINTMAVLLGRQPGALYDTLSIPKDIPLPPQKATLGMPADLLRQRPDIRRAERQLAAQTARIGVAKADLYPSLSLTGSFGYESVNTNDLFEPASNVFAFGPSLRWNIFSANRIRNRVKAQDAVARQYMLRYESTVLNALNEVENALRAYIEDRVRLEALSRAVDAARRSVTLSTQLYKQGLVNFQDVLDAQRDQFSLENELASARGSSAANFVNLYAALGGGWNPDDPEALLPTLKETVFE
ncbi:RND transporter [Desulfoplanes formicivorans]|uniref:RND transporter n=2 Tax=Desulfoplanes formicivorans TaxID=1592317 RepID=A0A194AI47_9BACT|nr:RND transporter [Desulfoplanes formicivorans]